MWKKKPIAEPPPNKGASAVEKHDWPCVSLISKELFLVLFVS